MTFIAGTGRSLILINQRRTKEMRKNQRLAKITGAKLEIKERNILNFWIFVDYEDGGSQGVGGLALDAWSEKDDRRIGTAYGCEMIRRILITLNVDDFSEMSGKHIWVIGKGEGFSFKPTGICRLRVDSKEEPKPLIFSHVYDEMTGTEGESDED